MTKTKLTDRQAAVLERVARRATIKEIAAEFSISESAVNQHIRSLKDGFGVETLAQLQRIYADISTGSSFRNCRNSASRKRQLPQPQVPGEKASRNDGGHPILFQDSAVYSIPAPWDNFRETAVVPGVLNGINARWARAFLMVALTLGLFVVVLVGLGVVQGISTALSDEVAPGNKP